MESLLLIRQNNFGTKDLKNNHLGPYLNAIKHFFARELNTKSGWVKIGIWERKYRIDIKKDCVAHVNYS